MIEKTTAFLNHLSRGGEFGHYWTKQDNRSTWYTAGDPPRPNGAPRDTYFGVNPVRAIPTHNAKGNETAPGRVRSQNKLVCAINCFFGDFDAKDFGSKAQTLVHIGELPVAPSVVVDSGGGYHAYWLLDEPFRDMERAADYLTRWVAFTGADKGVKDLARILRVPGTPNLKYKPAPVVKFVKCDLSLVYNIGTLVGLLPEVAPVGTFTQYTPPLEQKALPEPSAGQPRSARYWAQGIDTAVGMIHDSHRGEKHNALLRASRLLGGYVGGGLGNAREAAGVLENAIMSKPGVVSLSQAKQTIADGIAYGIARPITYEQKEAERSDWVRRHTPAKGNDVFLLNASADDEGNALCVNLLHGEKVAYCDAYGWMVYNGKFWECEGAEGQLGHFIVSTLVKRRVLGVQFDREGIVRVSRSNANRVRSCRYMLEKHRMVKVSELDQSPDLLNCNNGVVDLRTGEIEPHDPKQLFTYCIPVNYNPDANFLEWLNFLAGVAESQETIDYLQLAFGYSLTGHTWDEVLFYIQGPTRSGKGTLTETFLAVLGRLPLGTEADFSTFTSKRDGDTQNFDLAGLKPCRFVSASESSKYERLNSAKVKSATGGNDIRCAHKGKDLFSYKPQFKIWLSSNFPPRADVDDDAVWARLRVILFPNSFLGREDKQLKRKLREPRNLEAVLAWAIAGAQLWYNSPESGLPLPATVEAATKEARDSFDYVYQWVRECIAVTGLADNFIPNPSLYASYKEWCDANGVTPKKIGGLTGALKSKKLSAGTQKKHKGKNVRGLLGACFRADPHHEEEIPLNFVDSEEEIPF